MTDLIVTYILDTLPFLGVILAVIGYMKNNQRLKLMAPPLVIIGLVWWANLAVHSLIR